MKVLVLEYKKQEEKLKAETEAARQWQAKVAANKRREAGRRKRIEIKWQAEMDKERVLLRRKALKSNMEHAGQAVAQVDAARVYGLYLAGVALGGGNGGNTPKPVQSMYNTLCALGVVSAATASNAVMPPPG